MSNDEKSPFSILTAETAAEFNKDFHKALLLANGVMDRWSKERPQAVYMALGIALGEYTNRTLPHLPPDEVPEFMRLWLEPVIQQVKHKAAMEDDDESRTSH